MPSALQVHATDSIGTLVSYGLHGAMLAALDTVPVGRKGYAPGQLLIDYAAGIAYRNAGTYESCDFVEVLTDFVTRDGGLTLAAIPWTDTAEIALSTFGVSVGEDGPDECETLTRVSRKRVENFRGLGITANNDGRISECISTDNYIGAKLTSSDARIIDSDLFNNRDVGLWVAASAANCVSTHNHFYGARIACYNEGGEQFRSSNDTFADALVGYLGDTVGGGSAQAVISNALFQHNLIRDVVFRTWACRLVDCVINVQKQATVHNQFSISPITWVSLNGGTHKKVGVQFDGNENSISGSVVELNTYIAPNTASGVPAEAIWINGDSCKVVDTYIVDADGVNASIGIRILGTRSDVKIDATFRGFADANAKCLIIDSPGNCVGLDIKLRIPVGSGGSAKTTLAEYVTIGTTYKGRIELINTTTGAVTTYVDGVAI